MYVASCQTYTRLQTVDKIRPALLLSRWCVHSQSTWREGYELRLNVLCVSPALYRLRCVRRGQDLAPKAAIMVWQTAHPTRTQSAKPCSPASQRLNDLPLKPDPSHEPPIQPHDTGPAHVLSPCNSSTALAIVLLYICTECDCPLKCGNDVDDLFFFFFWGECVCVMLAWLVYCKVCMILAWSHFCTENKRDITLKCALVSVWWTQTSFSCLFLWDISSWKFWWCFPPGLYNYFFHYSSHTLNWSILKEIPIKSVCNWKVSFQAVVEFHQDTWFISVPLEPLPR